MLPQFIDTKYALASSDEEFAVIVSRARLRNLQKNIARFGFLASSYHIFEELTVDQLRQLIRTQPTLLSVSGADSLWPVIEDLKYYPALVSEFMCWQFVSSFTPLDFYPSSNWRDVIDLFEDNETKRLLLSGYADDFVALRFSVPETSVEALIAFETAEAAFFRNRIPRKMSNFYTNAQVSPRPGDTVVDCGACANAYGGQFVTDFIKMASPSGKVIAYEPIPEVFEALRRDVADEFSVILVNSAVWDRPTTLTFASDGISSRKISAATEQTSLVQSDKVSVRAERLDDLAEEMPIHFVKMDVEGAEYEALLGASELLRRDRPDLAICLYHSPEDFVRIPQLLKSLVPDYRMWLELNEGHCWAGMKLLASVRASF